MQDMAVFVTVESVLCLAFCFVSLKSINGEKNNKWFKVLNWYPGLLIFPVLFYILTQTIYAMPGTNFSIISYILAGVVFIAFPALSYFFRYLLPEKELRLEVYFLVSLFVCLIGLITTVNDTVVYARNETPLNIKALIISGGIFVVMFFIGYLWNKIKWIIFRKRKN
jgi:hypothetical protein